MIRRNTPAIGQWEKMFWKCARRCLQLTITWEWSSAKRQKIVEEWVWCREYWCSLSFEWANVFFTDNRCRYDEILKGHHWSFDHHSLTRKMKSRWQECFIDFRWASYPDNLFQTNAFPLLLCSACETVRKESIINTSSVSDHSCQMNRRIEDLRERWMGRTTISWYNELAERNPSSRNTGVRGE